MRLNIFFTAYLVVAALCWQINLTNSRTSTLWRLNPENGKITTGSEEHYVEKSNNKRNIITSRADTDLGIADPLLEIYKKDYIFYVIASTTNEGGSSYNGWTRQYPENLYEANETQNNRNNKTLTEHHKKEKSFLMKNGEKAALKAAAAAAATRATIENGAALIVEDRLDCGKPINYTKYDHLIGVGQRHYYHPLVPEPEVAYLFLGTNDEYAYRNFDLAALERRLRLALERARRDHENVTFELYTDIGNYFRILGDTRQAIECFRHAVNLRAHPDALLNLARILYNLEYFSDAILLSLDSINAAPKGYIPWQEYFMLGEIFKASGRVQESSFHLRRALELYPHHEPILKVLRDVENTVLSALHIYTVVIIIALAIAVFVVILTNIGSDICSSSGNYIGTGFCSTQFDADLRPLSKQRAMAMRSLKGLPSNARYARHRRF